jgi:(p)ppGpp synthase/HD superfamily hydrolase
VTLLQRAIELAVQAHRGDEDPPGEPYIVHPIRVLLRVSEADDAKLDERLRCVAILHDSIERGKMTAKRLRKEGMPRAVVRSVQLLTHRENVSYADYVVKLKKDPTARTVKLADLAENADLRRITFRGSKVKKDSRRAVRYAASYKFLTDQMTEAEYRRIMKRAE